jgi:hypothetical protein
MVTPLNSFSLSLSLFQTRRCCLFLVFGFQGHQQDTLGYSGFSGSASCSGQSEAERQLLIEFEPRNGHLLLAESVCRLQQL